MNRLLRIAVALACLSAFASSCVQSDRPPPKVNLYLQAGKTAGLMPEELQIEDFIKKAVETPICAEYFADFFETAYIVVSDYDDLCFTVTIKDGAASFKRGVDVDTIPDLVVPMTAQDCEGLYHIMADGQITDEEEYRIYYVTFVPSYRSMLLRDEMKDPKVLQYLGVADFTHVVLRNENSYPFGRLTQPMAISILRTDDQWVAFAGLQGDPDVRMEVTVAQAKEFTTMCREAMTAEDSMATLKKIRGFLNDVTVYRRGE